MKNITAVFLKQLTDTFKNKTVLIQFVMFPVLTLVMENTITLENMPEHFFAKLFAVMFVGMAPLTTMASIISEEKEKNTLRVLIMSNVSPAQYLAGIGAYVFMMGLAASGLFAWSCGCTGKDLALFLAAMSAGIILSGLTGAVIGIFGKNMMAATSMYIPVMAVFSFLPMISMFNESVKKIARFTYSQQISEMINGIGTSQSISASSIGVLAANFAIALLIFVLIYRKKGVE